MTMQGFINLYCTYAFMYQRNDDLYIVNLYRPFARELGHGTLLHQTSIEPVGLYVLGT